MINLNVENLQNGDVVRLHGSGAIARIEGINESRAFFQYRNNDGGIFRVGYRFNEMRLVNNQNVGKKLLPFLNRRVS